MQQVDKGAIRFVLSGANIMCPGLTSPGAMMTDVPKETIVVSVFIIYYIILVNTTELQELGKMFLNFPFNYFNIVCKSKNT